MLETRATRLYSGCSIRSGLDVAGVSDMGVGDKPFAHCSAATAASEGGSAEEPDWLLKESASTFGSETMTGLSRVLKRLVNEESISPVSALLVFALPSPTIDLTKSRMCGE